jgi:hypothetical protein
MRAFIRKLGLGSDEHHLTDEPGIPETGRDGVSGRAAADDQRFRVSSRTRRRDQTRYPPRTAIANA